MKPEPWSFSPLLGRGRILPRCFHDLPGVRFSLGASVHAATPGTPRTLQVVAGLRRVVRARAAARVAAARPGFREAAALPWTAARREAAVALHPAACFLPKEPRAICRSCQGAVALA